MYVPTAFTQPEKEEEMRCIHCSLTQYKYSKDAALVFEISTLIKHSNELDRSTHSNNTVKFIEIF